MTTGVTDDLVAIGRLQSAYADVVNRRAWSELDTLFVTDARIRIDTVTRPVIEVVGAGALGDFIGSAVERFAFFEFVPLNAHTQLERESGGDGDPDAARSRWFMCEVRRDVDTLDWSIAYGVYHDRYRRTTSGWRFEQRDYQSLTRTDGPVFPFPRHRD